MQIKIFEFNPVSVNTYLLYDDTKEAAIMDCGASSKIEQEELTDYIRSHGLKIKRLLNTHLHFDHALGNRFIYDTYGVKPQYHESEDSMPGLRMQAGLYGFTIHYTPIGAEHFLGNGDIVSFGNTAFIALLTPGHSPGSLSYYNERDRCVFSGDVLFQHDIGRTDLWGGNEKTLLHSIRTKLLTLPDDTIVYPGHGPSTTILEEKQHNPYL